MNYIIETQPRNPIDDYSIAYRILDNPERELTTSLTHLTLAAANNHLVVEDEVAAELIQNYLYGYVYHLHKNLFSEQVVGDEDHRNDLVMDRVATVTSSAIRTGNPGVSQLLREVGQLNMVGGVMSGEQTELLTHEGFAAIMTPGGPVAQTWEIEEMSGASESRRRYLVEQGMNALVFARTIEWEDLISAPTVSDTQSEVFGRVDEHGNFTPIIDERQAI